VGEAYNIAKDSKKSVMIIEWRDLYDKEWREHKFL
jgi:hypothetical protein